MRLPKSMFLLLLCTAGAASASGKIAYMEEKEGGVKRIVLADSDGRNPTYLSEAGSWGLYPDLNADASAVAFSSGPEETSLAIVLKDLTRGVIEHWTPPGGPYLHADFSGDGHSLAFSGPVGEGRAQRIGIIDLEGERRRGPEVKAGDTETYQPRVKVVPSAHDSYFPALSSSGAFLVYQRNDGATKTLVKHELGSGKDLLLTDPAGVSMSPSLSFDDRLVVFTAKREGLWDLYLRDLASGESWQVTRTPFQDFAPAFRPDGGIVYAANPEGRFQLFEISASSVRDRSFAARPLISSSGDLYAPSLSGENAYASSLLPAIPGAARSSFGAVEHEGRVYIAGGHEGHEHTYPPESFSNRLDIFEPGRGWRAGAPLSLPRHGFGLAAWRGYIYAFGGFAYSAEHRPKWKSVDLIERYDISNDRWEVVGRLSQPRSSNVVARVGSKVYLLGGWDSTPQKKDDAEGRFSRNIEIFDLESGILSVSPQALPDPLRRALSGVVVGEEIFLVGGLGVGANHFELLDSVTAFHTVTGSWRELPRLPFPTFAPAAGVLGGRLFVFGGMRKTGAMEYEYVNHIHGLDLANGSSWKHLGRYLSEAKGFGQVVSLRSGLLGILGGHTYEGEEDHPVPTFETFGLAPSSWK